MHLHGARHCASTAAGAKQGRQLRRQEVWLREGIRTLNELGGRGAVACERTALSLPQQLAVRHLARAYGAMSSPPDGHDPLVAWRTLQGSRSGYSDTSEEVLGATAGKLAPYRKGAASLPREVAGKVDLAACLPDSLQSLLVRGDGLLRFNAEGQPAGVEGVPDVPARPAMDAVLRRGGHPFGGFLQELYDLGAVEPAPTVREVAGLFFVRRKDDKLRMIWDTRRSNAHFSPPPWCPLPSGEALACIESSGDLKLTAPSADVSVCFYQYQLPEHLRGYFCLPPIDLKFVPEPLCSVARPFAVKGKVSFQSRVVPMGWSWAVVLVQACHLNLLKGVRPSDPWLTDKVPVNPVNEKNAVKFMYIDNFSTISGSEAEGRAVTSAMISTLREHGIDSSFDEEDADDYLLLGFKLSKERGTWQPSDKKLWRVIGALDYALTPGHLNWARRSRSWSAT